MDRRRVLAVSLVLVSVAAACSLAAMLAFPLALDVPSAAAQPDEDAHDYRLAFTSNRNGVYSIYTAKPDGADLVRLTEGPFDAQEISVSPDGVSIAYCQKQLTESGISLSVGTIAADGGAFRMLSAADGALYSQPTYSPDGSALAYVRAERGLGNIMAGAPGCAEMTRLTDGIWDMQPAWSPDGRRIAFTSMMGSRAEIFVVDAGGGMRERLTCLGAFSEHPVWSPDGKQIAFTSNCDGTTAVYTMNADGSSVRQLTQSRSLDIEPCWSPDGTRIAFSSDRDGGFAIYVADARMGQERRLTAEAPGWQMQPGWSPDGSRIAFTAGLDGEWDIYVANADGTGVQRVTTEPGCDVRPLWILD